MSHAHKAGLLPLAAPRGQDQTTQADDSIILDDCPNVTSCRNTARTVHVQLHTFHTYTVFQPYDTLSRATNDLGLDGAKLSLSARQDLICANAQMLQQLCSSSASSINSSLTLTLQGLIQLGRSHVKGSTAHDEECDIAFARCHRLDWWRWWVDKVWVGLSAR